MRPWASSRWTARNVEVLSPPPSSTRRYTGMTPARARNGLASGTFHNVDFATKRGTRRRAAEMTAGSTKPLAWLTTNRVGPLTISR